MIKEKGLKVAKCKDEQEKLDKSIGNKCIVEAS